MSLGSRKWVGVAIVMFLALGSGLVIGCADSGSAGLDEGPGMMYFYAEW